MAKFSLNIETHSAAVAEEGREHEIARILRDTAERIENGQAAGVLLDINGAQVGSWAMDLPALLNDGEDDSEHEDDE